MNSLSISITGIFVILAIGFTGLLLAAITNNRKTARRYRQAMSEKLGELRLSRMLAFHRIDQESYLHTEPVVDIEKQMQRCAGCAQTRRCEEVLADHQAADTRFCANDDDLQDIKRKRARAAA